MTYCVSFSVHFLQLQAYNCKDDHTGTTLLNTRNYFSLHCIKYSPSKNVSTDVVDLNDLHTSILRYVPLFLHDITKYNRNSFSRFGGEATRAEAQTERQQTEHLCALCAKTAY